MFWWQKNPPDASASSTDPALKPHNSTDGPHSILKSPGKPKSPGRMTRAERHAAGMERALKELERVAAHNPELADALGLIQRGEDGTITVGSLRRAEAALREKYAAAAERKKAEMEAEARAREDEAELARLKAGARIAGQRGVHAETGQSPRAVPPGMGVAGEPFPGGCHHLPRTHHPGC
jgi:hypothetical protein